LKSIIPHPDQQQNGLDFPTEPINITNEELYLERSSLSLQGEGGILIGGQQKSIRAHSQRPS
jgi:hypothetical protein